MQRLSIHAGAQSRLQSVKRYFAVRKSYERALRSLERSIQIVSHADFSRVIIGRGRERNGCVDFYSVAAYLSYFGIYLRRSRARAIVFVFNLAVQTLYFFNGFAYHLVAVVRKPKLERERKVVRPTRVIVESRARVFALRNGIQHSASLLVSHARFFLLVG